MGNGFHRASQNLQKKLSKSNPAKRLDASPITGGEHWGSQEPQCYKNMKLLQTRILREHQQKMLRYSMHVKHPAWFVDPRLGKTLVAIRQCRMRSLERILIVAPYSALYGWQEQLALDGCESEMITGDREKRLELLKKWKQFSLFNKEGFLVIPEIGSMPWDAVICDESTFLKSPQSQVSDFYTRNFRNIKMRAIMTGTPAPESELDYFQQLKFLNPNILGHKNYWNFRGTYFKKAINDDHLWFISKAGRENLAQALAQNCFFLKRKEVHLGGEKIYQVRKAKLNNHDQKIYNKIEEDFVLALPGEKPQMTKWAMQRFIWMRRFTGGLINNQVVQGLKSDLLIELIDGEFFGEQLIIWCAFIEELQYVFGLLKSRLHKVGCIHGGIQKGQREQIRQSFQRKELQIIVLQPESFKHGTDLSAAETMIYYSSPLGLETREQTEDRFVDITKNDSLLVIDLAIEDTIDEEIIAGLKRKLKRGELMQSIIAGCQKRELQRA
jgi:SNF2 family DNA or RNA helicase